MLCLIAQNFQALDPLECITLCARRHSCTLPILVGGQFQALGRFHHVLDALRVERSAVPIEHAQAGQLGADFA